MQKRPVAAFRLLAANNELVILDRHAQLVAGETCNRKRDAKTIPAGLFNVVGRVTIAGRFGRPFEQLLKMLESEKEGAVEADISVHFQSPP
jgi:hypothetical protein